MQSCDTEDCIMEAVKQYFDTGHVYCQTCWDIKIRPELASFPCPRSSKCSLNDMNGYMHDRKERSAEPGCFATSCCIEMADKSYKALRDVEVGDLVSSFDFLTRSPVSATVIWIGVTNKYASTIRFGDMFVTPGHPILYRGDMVDCINFRGWTRGPVTEVCNLLLDIGHCIFARANWVYPLLGVFHRGIWCSTLGDPFAYDADYKPTPPEWKMILVYGDKAFAHPTKTRPVDVDVVNPESAHDIEKEKPRKIAKMTNNADNNEYDDDNDDAGFLLALADAAVKS